MFNFFDELKKTIKNQNILDRYNIINMSGKILYVEGHTGIVSLSKENISFKFKGGVIIVEGKDLVLSELMPTTLKITGSILRVESL